MPFSFLHLSLLRIYHTLPNQFQSFIRFSLYNFELNQLIKALKYLTNYLKNCGQTTTSATTIIDLREWHQFVLLFLAIN